MFEIELIIYIKMDWALNNLLWLIYHKTQPTNQPIKEVTLGSCKLPFICSTQKQIKKKFPKLRCMHTHLVPGARPSRKVADAHGIKQYLHHISIASDSLLYVKRKEAFSDLRECRVVLQQIFTGLLHSFHIKLNHPSRNRLNQVISRYFFTLAWVILELRLLDLGCSLSEMSVGVGTGEVTRVLI